ncbi:putative inositol-pentakisphosphate 2-kinase [Dioscorea sansibarensis]
MAMILGADDANDWFYKGEGAANLVLGYCGSSPALLGKVLRVEKIQKGATRSAEECEVLTVHEKLVWAAIGEPVESASKKIIQQAFVMTVLNPLLGSEHMDVGMHVSVSSEFLKIIEKNVHNKRPAWRVDAAEIDLLCDSALLMSDHSIFPSGASKEGSCISVEIKPKCGFLPCSDCISEANTIKKSVTRFKMHQFLKLHKKEVSQMSKYDPLDLFSGSIERINLAIRSLFATPQNNFRIFSNGSLIYGGLGGSMDSIECEAKQLQEMKKAAEDRIKVLIQGDFGIELDSFLELVSEAIFKSGMLNQLLATQKLDIIDIEGAIHAYYNVIGQPCLVCKSLDDAAPLRCYSLLHSLSLEESLKIVREYLTATTAKDCSLMISFRPKEGGDVTSNCISLRSADQVFEYKVNFIDMDIKPLEKMVYYYKLDQKIVKFYMENRENGGSPCDSDGGAENIQI